MAKKDRGLEMQPAAPCTGCQRLEDELARSEQRSYERLREISALCSSVQEERRLEVLGRLRALEERLRLSGHLSQG